MTTIKNSIRKIVLGLLVAGLAVVGSAFTNKEISKTVDMEWFELQPGTDPEVATNYTLVLEKPECSGNGDICAIYAPKEAPNSIHPNLDEADQSETLRRQ